MLIDDLIQLALVPQGSVDQRVKEGPVRPVQLIDAGFRVCQELVKSFAACRELLQYRNGHFTRCDHYILLGNMVEGICSALLLGFF